MNKKSLFVWCLSTSLLALPATSSAFSVVNATKDIFTISINNQCSTEFGNVPMNRETAVSDSVIKKLCGSNIDNCVGRIHKLENCGGMEIGSFLFDKEGLVKFSPTTHAHGYTVKPIVHMNLVAVGQK